MTDDYILTLPHITDFDLTGDGSAPAWRDIPFVPLQRVGQGTATYPTRGRLAYSDTAIYGQIVCEDTRLTCTHEVDFADLYAEDVVEFFLQPNPATPVYLEFELSPLNYELTLLSPNCNGKYRGWIPWKYDEPRRIRHAVTVDGPQAPGAEVRGWSAEFAVPYELLRELAPPPKPGDTWRANLYRIDYDAGRGSHWAWCPRTSNQFHDMPNFGTLHFA